MPSHPRRNMQMLLELCSGIFERANSYWYCSWIFERYFMYRCLISKNGKERRNLVFKESIITVRNVFSRIWHKPDKIDSTSHQLVLYNYQLLMHIHIRTTFRQIKVELLKNWTRQVKLIQPKGACILILAWENILRVGEFSQRPREKNRKSNPESGGTVEPTNRHYWL